MRVRNESDILGTSRKRKIRCPSIRDGYDVKYTGQLPLGDAPPLGVEVASERGGTEGLGVLAAAELLLVTPTFDAPTLGVEVACERGGTKGLGVLAAAELLLVMPTFDATTLGVEVASERGTKGLGVLP